MELKEILLDAGLDYDTILFRFSGNETLLKRFLLKFPQDPSFEELRGQVEKMDLQGVEKSAHTLKGLSANLGFAKLSEACAQMVAAVREGRGNEIPTLFEQTRAEYDAAMRCVRRIG